MVSNRIFSSVVSLLVLAAAVMFPSAAIADGIATCHGCTFSQFQAKAKQTGLGYIYIVDATNIQLRLYHVVQDSPSVRLASQVPVDPILKNRFEAIADTRQNNEPSLVINLSPDEYYPNGFFTDNPFGGFANVSAYTVLASVTVRNGLGANLGAAKTTIPGMVGLNQTLTAAVMSAGGMFGGGPVTITYILTFRNGTTVKYVLQANSVNEAKYVEGSARDTDNNPIPDGSLHQEGVASGYIGEFYFSTQENLNSWIDAMERQGVPVTGVQRGEERRIECSWSEDFKSVNCRYLGGGVGFYPVSTDGLIKA